jgi:hypothetical protein
MASPRTPQNPGPAGTQPRNDQAPAEPPRANLLMRIQILTGGYLARHPALLAVLEWLGWNNPGGSINP